MAAAAHRRRIRRAPSLQARRSHGVQDLDHRSRVDQGRGRDQGSGLGRHWDFRGSPHPDPVDHPGDSAGQDQVRRRHAVLDRVGHPLADHDSCLRRRLRLDRSRCGAQVRPLEVPYNPQVRPSEVPCNRPVRPSEALSCTHHEDLGPCTRRRRLGRHNRVALALTPVLAHGGRRSELLVRPSAALDRPVHPVADA